MCCNWEFCVTPTFSSKKVKNYRHLESHAMATAKRKDKSKNKNKTPQNTCGQRQNKFLRKKLTSDPYTPRTIDQIRFVLAGLQKMVYFTGPDQSNLDEGYTNCFSLGFRVPGKYANIKGEIHVHLCQSHCNPRKAMIMGNINYYCYNTNTRKGASDTKNRDWIDIYFVDGLDYNLWHAVRHSLNDYYSDGKTTGWMKVLAAYQKNTRANVAYYDTMELEQENDDRMHCILHFYCHN